MYIFNQKKIFFQLCTGSLCSKVAYTPSNTVTWVECFVEAKGDTVADKEKQCLLGCSKYFLIHINH